MKRLNARYRDTIERLTRERDELRKVARLNESHRDTIERLARERDEPRQLELSLSELNDEVGGRRRSP